MNSHVAFIRIILFLASSAVIVFIHLKAGAASTQTQGLP